MAKIKEILIPRHPGLAHATVVEVAVTRGQKLKVHDLVVILRTADGSNVPILCPYTGKVVDVKVRASETITAGRAIISIELEIPTDEGLINEYFDPEEQDAGIGPASEITENESLSIVTEEERAAIEKKRAEQRKNDVDAQTVSDNSVETKPEKDTQRQDTTAPVPISAAEEATKIAIKYGARPVGEHKDPKEIKQPDSKQTDKTESSKDAEKKGEKEKSAPQDSKEKNASSLTTQVISNTSSSSETISTSTDAQVLSTQNPSTRSAETAPPTVQKSLGTFFNSLANASTVLAQQITEVVVQRVDGLNQAIDKAFSNTDLNTATKSADTSTSTSSKTVASEPPSAPRSSTENVSKSQTQTSTDKTTPGKVESLAEMISRSLKDPQNKVTTTAASSFFSAQNNSETKTDAVIPTQTTKR